MKYFSCIFILFVAVDGSTLCAHKNKSCTYQLWKNESDQPHTQTCQMVYYKLNSTECAAYHFNYALNLSHHLGDVRLKAYDTEKYRQTLFNVSFKNIKWKKVIMRFTRMGYENEVNSCRKFIIWDNTSVPTNSVLTYDCPWSDSSHEGLDVAFEYEYMSPIYAYNKYIFKVPRYKNFGKQTDVKSLQVFTYLDVTDSDYLHLHIQEPPKKYNITGYLIEVIRERSNISTRLTVQILKSDEIVNGELVFPYPTWNEFGFFYFNVSVLSDVCEENMCLKSSTPKIFMGQRKSSLVIGIVGASVIIFALFYAMFFWNRQKGNKEETPPRVLLVYNASLNSHCNVVRSLARLLNDVLHVDVLLDVFGIPETHHQNPLLWFNQAFRDASHIIYIGSPELPPSKATSDNIYRLYGVSMKAITAKIVSNSNAKQLIVLTFPYSINAVPGELTSLRRFDLMKDMDSFVNSLVMLPYQSWTFLHIYRPNRFRGEPQYMELLSQIQSAQKEVEMFSDYLTSTGSPKVTITHDENDESPNEDEHHLLNLKAHNFTYNLSDLDLSGGGTSADNKRVILKSPHSFSYNVQDIAK